MRKLRTLLVLTAAVALSLTAYAIAGDVDGDGDVDIEDILAILSVLGSSASTGDPRDVDADGTITVLDARAAVLTCTLPFCDAPGAPSMTSPSANNAPENQLAVVDIQSTDPAGFTEGSGLTYSLAGGADVGKFSIVPGSGVLTFIAPPDYESPADANADNIYQIEVVVTNTAGKSGMQSLTALVTNVNEAPIFDSIAAPTAMEKQSVALDVQSSDPDGETESGGGLTYQLTGGVDQALLAIDKNTGLLTFLTLPDFTTPIDSNADNTYQASVTVTDAGGLSDQLALSVTVTDTTEAPQITSDASPQVEENQTVVIDIDASDPDGSTEGSGLNYHVSGGADQNLFSINSDTGVLSFVSVPDFESPGDSGANNVYEVQVTVTDPSALTGVQDVAVTVIGVNESPRITSDGGGSAATMTTDENQIIVTDVDASDPDGSTEGGGGLSYTLSGADAARFSIAADGALGFDIAPDFENPVDAGNDNVYNLVVTVTDPDGLRATQDIAVTVVDNNESPSITSDGGGTTAVKSVAENQTAVTDVDSFDPDGETDNGGGLTYSLAGADATEFSITAAGILSFKTVPDFESPVDSDADNVYNVQVLATDLGGKVGMQAIAVAVSNVNEAPAITSDGGGAIAAISTAENQTAVTDVDSSDPDGETDNGGGLTYSLVGSDAARFFVNAAGALTFLVAPDFDIAGDANGDNDYQLQVIVTDAGGLSEQQDITVTVTNVVEDCDAFYAQTAASCVEGTERLLLYQGDNTQLSGYPVAVAPGQISEWDSAGNEVTTSFDIKSDLVYSVPILLDGIYALTLNSSGGQVEVPDTIVTRNIQFGELTTSSVEFANCPDCAGGTTGVCQTSGTKLCADLSAGGRCPRRYAACLETVIQKSDVVMPSLYLKNWHFQAATNVLRYTFKLELKPSLNVVPPAAGPADLSAQVALLKQALNIATKATIRSPDGSDQLVDLKTATSVVNGNIIEVTLEFNHFEADQELAYN